MRYAFIRTQERAPRITRLCAALALSRSGYYAWRDRIGANQARRRGKETIKLLIGGVERRGNLHQILRLGRILDLAKAPYARAEKASP